MHPHPLLRFLFLFLGFASASTGSPSFQESIFCIPDLNSAWVYYLQVPRSGQETVFDVYSWNHGPTLSTDIVPWHNLASWRMAFQHDYWYFWLLSYHFSSSPNPSPSLSFKQQLQQCSHEFTQLWHFPVLKFLHFFWVLKYPLRLILNCIFY